MDHSTLHGRSSAANGHAVTNVGEDSSMLMQANNLLMHHAAHQPRLLHVNGGMHVTLGDTSVDAIIREPVPASSGKVGDDVDARMRDIHTSTLLNASIRAPTSTAMSSDDVRHVRVPAKSRRYIGDRCSFVIGRDTWYESTDIPCQHDLYPFSTPPVPIVQEWDPNTNVCVVYGCFYSLNNVKAYLRDRNDPLKEIKIQNTVRFVAQVMKIDVSQCAPSPSAKWLSSYGGPIPVETARCLFSQTLVLDQPNVKYVPAPILAEIQARDAALDFSIHVEPHRAQVHEEPRAQCVTAQTRRETVHRHASKHVLETVIHAPLDLNSTYDGLVPWDEDMMQVAMRDMIRDVPADHQAQPRTDHHRGNVIWDHVLDRREPLIAGSLVANFLNNVEVPNSWHAPTATTHAGESNARHGVPTATFYDEREL